MHRQLVEHEHQRRARAVAHDGEDVHRARARRHGGRRSLLQPCVAAQTRGVATSADLRRGGKSPNKVQLREALHVRSRLYQRRWGVGVRDASFTSARSQAGGQRGSGS
eukprot:4131118-Pleurochrysis_carterae.AAC.1